MADTNDGEPGAGHEKLCVLVPCLNEEELVRRTVEEVLRHANTISIPVEVVMIDDGATDGTRAVMQELNELNPPTLWSVHQKVLLSPYRDIL